MKSSWITREESQFNYKCLGGGERCAEKPGSAGLELRSVWNSRKEGIKGGLSRELRDRGTAF